KLGQRQLWPPVQHIALVLGDDQRKAGDLRREVAQLDPPKIGKRNFRLSIRFATTPVDLGLDGTHFLVGNDQEIARTAGWIEDPDLGDALAQVQQHTGVITRFIKLFQQVVEKQRVQRLQDVGDTGVVHPQLAALLVLGVGLYHRAEDVRVDL